MLSIRNPLSRDLAFLPPCSFKWGSPFPKGANPAYKSGRRRRALLQADNTTVSVYCATACDWANSVANAPADSFAVVDDALVGGWDSFSQTLFWMAIIFVPVLLLHLLVIHVVWPRYLPTKPMPTFLTFPRIEIQLALVGFTGACAACAAAIGTNVTWGIVAGTLVLWGYPVMFLVRRAPPLRA